ncbi:MAG: N-acetylmuramoyl-L-alanine amidase [Lentisphaerae bacterium]|nr:N-acetylmuramoyl-L-alanine amidase [Lentisphaerota bacterium]
MGRGRAAWLRLAVALLLAWVSLAAAALNISNAHSPFNPSRPARTHTRYIILHTTEGAAAGSLAKIKRYGEAHYVVSDNGHVYRVIDRSRIAYHAGRSMWDGQRDLDKFSIGIEVVGYHNRDITAAQYTALRELLEDLQSIYTIPDERVLTHSMVAYGAPNRWHKQSHRGRKRCGMCFAKRTTRLKLGLTKQPLSDPDVKAKRLIQADPYLASVLYGSASDQAAAEQSQGQDAFVISGKRTAWLIARDRAESADTRYLFPDGTSKRGNEISDWRAIPAGTRVSLGDSQSENAPEQVRHVNVVSPAQSIAGDEANVKSTIYFLPDGRVQQGHELSRAVLAALPVGTRVLVGYMHGGYITAKRSAHDICGPKWRAHTTLYRLADGSLQTGDQMDENAIPPRTMIFFPE